jgi:predicted small metal-binding protein
MKTQLTCPCGTTIRGTDEDELVERVQQHLNDEHDGRTYDRETILFMAS